MPSTVVDLSARSQHIRDEPWHLHFWETTPTEYLAFLKEPRATLKGMGIDLPDDCRIETSITNHDWMSSNTNGLLRDDGVVICNVGGGNVALNFYRITSYAHMKTDVGQHTAKKKLLHQPTEEKKPGT